MLYRPLYRLLFLLVLAGGALAPPVLYADDYLLFASEVGGTRGQVYTMDGTGNLALREERQVALDTNSINVSPDGRVVVFSGWDKMTVFFIDDNGSLSLPLERTYYTNYPMSWAPVAFHRTLPLLYLGYHYLTSYEYLEAKREVQYTSQTVTIPDTWFVSYNLGYSPWSNTVVLIKKGYQIPKWDVQTVNIKADGSFGSLNPALKLNTNSTHFAVSPNGRWAASASPENKRLQLVQIAADGTLSLTHDMDAPFNQYAQVIFTPDSRRLLAMNLASAILSSFLITPETGQLVWESSLTMGLSGGDLLAMDPAVSPDGRFAAFRSVNPAKPSHNLIHIVRLTEDGGLIDLPEKAVDVDHYVCELAFAPFPHNAARDWVMYE